MEREDVTVEAYLQAGFNRVSWEQKNVESSSRWRHRTIFKSLWKYFGFLVPTLWSPEFEGVSWPIVQCDQIGRFLNVLGDKYSFKSCPNVWRLLGLFRKRHFVNTNCFRYFLSNLRRIFGYFLDQHLVTLNYSRVRFSAREKVYYALTWSKQEGK